MTAPITLETLPATVGAERWEARLGAVDVRYGPGRLADLGEVARSLGGTRALVVTDAGVERAGHAAAARESLAAAGLETDTFSGFEPNPTSGQIAAGAAAIGGADLIVAVGGGSAMDCAKGINFVATNGGRMEDYKGWGRAARPLLPSVAAPATAGTGSEAQSYALVTSDADGRKMACGDPKARFRVVLLDPRLPATAPRAVAAAAAIDAVSHAVESYVTRTGSPISRALAGAAWRHLEGGLEPVLAAPGDLAAQGRMLVGAHLAGAAIEASMLGAAHACANPLTARFGVAHGLAVGLVLPSVVRFNAEAAEPLYAELETGGSAAVAARVEALRAAGGLPGRLSEVGVPRHALPELARLAAEEWTAGHNPRPVGERELLEIYESAY